ncbi:MAG: SHOCT domain-containing protein [Bdellovibrio sp.]|nr:SHOCT domain-containing protein [Bdellovibrio sp.]
MVNYYWTDWYAGWGWMLWLGMVLLVFSSFGNWGYSYTSHRRFRDTLLGKDALEILTARYASGLVNQQEFFRMKEEILLTVKERAQLFKTKDQSTSSKQFQSDREQHYDMDGVTRRNGKVVVKSDAQFIK